MPVKTCEGCGKSFEASNKGRPKRFCSTKCRVIPPDPLAEKRQRLAELMREAGKDSGSLERDIRSLPESQLDYLIDFYGDTGLTRYVW